MEIIKMIIYLFSLLSGCYGFFSWGHAKYDCDGTVTMYYDYNTDEVVTSIQWYKQPGDILIAEKRGISIPFRVSDAYKGRVSQYERKIQKAALQFTGFTEADDGFYSCNVSKQALDSTDTSYTSHTISIHYMERCPKTIGEGTQVTSPRLYVIVLLVLVTSLFCQY